MVRRDYKNDHWVFNYLPNPCDSEYKISGASTAAYRGKVDILKPGRQEGHAASGFCQGFLPETV